jgi:F0F1-type ATP synthase epsilon subunit
MRETPPQASMLVELAIAPVRIREGDRDRHRILVNGGFLHVTPGEEETRGGHPGRARRCPEEIDPAAARARGDELQRRAEEEGDAGVQVELAKTLMRATVAGNGNRAPPGGPVARR